MLFDLGPHLIDQALVLLGPARSVYAEVRALRPGAEVDDDFFLALEHESGARSHLWGTMLAAQAGPRLRALGTRGRLREVGPRRAGGRAPRRARRPRDPGFGEEPPSAWGTARNRRDTPSRCRPSRAATSSSTSGMERAIRDSSDPHRCRSRPASRRSSDRGGSPKRGGARRHRPVTRSVTRRAPTRAPRGRTFARMRSERGQATVEWIGLAAAGGAGAGGAEPPRVEGRRAGASERRSPTR